MSSHPEHPAGSRIALCFPGQGSQAAGMAAGLLDDTIARSMLAIADELGLDLGTALEGDDATLRATEIAQPALLLVECALAARIRAGEVSVAAAAGHSVGEYAALVAAGALDAPDAMRLVVARGRAMARMRQGSMAALLGGELSIAEEVCREAEAAGLGPVVVANLNAPGQVVISGTSEGVEAALVLARQRGVRRALPLNVSGAFHSPLMAEAATSFGHSLDEVALRDAAIPVACNVDGVAVTDTATLRDRLRRQLVSPVRWTDCVATLVALGVEVLVEVGPGAVLTGLARRIAPQVRALAVATPAAAAQLGGQLLAGVGG